MNPASPDSNNDQAQQSDLAPAEQRDSETTPSKAESSSATSSPVTYNRRWSDRPGISPLENLQRRYSDQLSKEIEKLEAQKAKLQQDIATLKQNYKRLKAEAQTTIDSQSTSATETAANQLKTASSKSLPPQTEDTTETSNTNKISPAERLPRVERGPKLPGEKEVPPPAIVAASSTRSSSTLQKERSIELPTPATSQRRRQQSPPKKAPAQSTANTTPQRGLILSAIATLITAWHYGLVSTLHQGGSWFGINIGQLGLGFVPTVALLWLRMLVLLPPLVLLAPQLHRTTWEDLLDWFYSRERLLIPLVGSGVALFCSQVFVYQSIGSIGPAIGATLLFLYPLSAIPLGWGLQQEKSLTAFGLLAVVAIAMGGLLVVRPAFTTSPTAVGLGVLASIARSLYIVLTNRGYRLLCHPIPTAIVQFSTVAVLGSLVLLVKPLKLIDMSWVSFCLWGLLIGVLMLVAYFFTYASLLNIRSKTAIIAAATPTAALLLGLNFTPRPALQIIQWTGILLVTIGGIALGKEKLGKEN